MVDRQDIDALLISALYGELTPADEARLSAHLESHPADKSALADLTRTRATVLESRFLTVQLEPPQAVSAMLLQEASARRKVVVATEPVAKEGWFSRFVGSFARHPAMAAAAMLVVVLGFAGTMYMRGGAKDASLDQTTSTFGGERAPGAPAPAVAEAKQLESAAGSAYEAQLADPHAGPATGGDFKATDKGENENKEAAKKDSVADLSKAPAREAPKVATPPRTYITTEGSKNRPMDLDERENKPDTATASVPDSSRGRRTPNGVIVVDGRAPAADPTVAGPNAPKPPVAPAPRPQTVKGAGGAVGGDEQRDRNGGEADKNEKDPDAQWARDQHVKVANAVKANNCKEASSLALAISNRAPGYYQQNVENDITLKKCVTYINAARDQEAERQTRARALQKRNADEAAKRAAPPAAADKSTK